MKKTAVLFLIFIFLAQPVFAYTYLNIYIDEAGNAEFLGETDQANIILPIGISVQDGQIRGFTQELTTKAAETWTFSYSLKDAEIKAILPKGSTLKNMTNGEIFLERERISVYFQDSLTINYSVNNTESSNLDLILIIIALLAGLILAYIYREKLSRLFKPRVIYKKPKQKDHIDMIKHILNQREKQILEKLKSTGKIKMSHLRKLCDIPKASFSRHIQKLEKKKLVIKSGEGKSKFVDLAKKI